MVQDDRKEKVEESRAGDTVCALFGRKPLPGACRQRRHQAPHHVSPQAADILHRQREHLTSGVKLWALGVWPIFEAGNRRRYAFETELIARALRKGYVLANIQKCEGVKMLAE